MIGIRVADRRREASSSEGDQMRDSSLLFDTDTDVDVDTDVDTDSDVDTDLED